MPTHHHRGAARIIPPNPNALLLPYQQRWVADRSRIKLMEKGRQIGMTWASAYGLVRRKALRGNRFDAWVSSRDALQARLFLDDCRAFANILQLASTSLGATTWEPDASGTLVLTLANGNRIHSLSSNPNAQAGKRGDRLLDEFALHPDPQQLYAIAYPGISWGGLLEIISTHRGSDNTFNRLLEEIRHKGNPKKISLHSVSLERALADGFLYKLQEKLPADDPRLAMDEAAYFDATRAGCPDEATFLQEYQCQPADDEAAFLTYDLIGGCEYAATEMPENLFPDADALPNGSERHYFLGVDIGRVHDLTVFWLVEHVGGICLTRHVESLRGTTFHEQEERLAQLLNLAPLRRVCIDQTGLGLQFAERMQARFGQGRVEGITLTAGVKEALATRLRIAFEARSIRIPDDATIRADLHRVRRETTVAGNIRFSATRNRDGHADYFWALALALHAAGIDKPDTVMAWEPIEHIHHRTRQW